MKTIILYSLIAIFIFGIVATSFTNRSNTKTILIQSFDNSISSVMLDQSAKIISNRLKDFSSKKFEISVIKEKNQIQVALTDNWDLKIVGHLLLQKGTLAFYETYNRKSLTDLLNGDNQLFLLLKSDDNSVKIGCTSVVEVGKVIDYLNTLGLNSKCKFVWSQNSDNQNVCLYALKSDSENGKILTGSDIESVTSNQDKVSKNFEIEIRLKKYAVELWANATKRNIKNTIAIVLDNNVISAPIVNSVIENGNCIIAGDYIQNEVRYITALIKNGELPVNFEIVR